MTGMDVLFATKQKIPRSSCDLMTAHGSIDTAVEAMQAWFRFPLPPCEADRLRIYGEQRDPQSDKLKNSAETSR